MNATCGVVRWRWAVLSGFLMATSLDGSFVGFETEDRSKLVHTLSPSLALASTGEGTAAAKIASVQKLIDSNQTEMAMKEVEMALKSHPKAAQLHFQKGHLLRERAQFKPAITSLLEALKLNPKSHQAKQELALTYLQMGESKAAKVLLAELQKDAPKRAKALKATAKRMKLSW